MKRGPTKRPCAVAVAQHVADVLAQEALDALAELLHALDVLLVHPVSRRRRAPARLRREGLDALVLLVVPGDVADQVLDHREGLDGLHGDRLLRSSKMFIRVMQARRGLPLISMLHEPHLPALQFQRTARSPADAWPGCGAARRARPCPRRPRLRTLSNSPPSHRRARSGTCATPLIGTHPCGPPAPRSSRERSPRDRDPLASSAGGSGRSTFSTSICPSVGPFRDHDVVGEPLVALALEVETRVGAAALLADQRGARHGLGDDHQRCGGRQRLVPAGVVLAGPCGLDVGSTLGLERARCPLDARRSELGASRTMPTWSCP